MVKALQDGVEAPPEEELPLEHGEDIHFEPETDGQANGSAIDMPALHSLRLDEDHSLLRDMRLSSTQEVSPGTIAKA